MPNLQASFFAIANPLRLLQRRLHRFSCRQLLSLRQRELEVRWSARAARELRRRERPLIVELQLYFSCVVKKRVLFHDSADFESRAVNEDLRIAFRPVAAAACDPREFAASYPPGKKLSAAAARMLPRVVELDFRRQRWCGQFYY